MVKRYTNFQVYTNEIEDFYSNFGYETANFQCYQPIESGRFVDDLCYKVDEILNKSFSLRASENILPREEIKEELVLTRTLTTTVSKVSKI